MWGNSKYLKAILIILILALFQVCLFGGQHWLNYDFTYMDSQKPFVKIKMTMPLKKGKSVKIKFPKGVGENDYGLDKFYRNYFCDVGTFKRTDNPYEFIITNSNSKNDFVSLSYDLYQSWNGPLGAKGCTRFFPAIQQTYVSIFAQYGIAIPEWLGKKKIDFCIKWNLPEGWKSFNSFGAFGKNTRI